MVKSVVILFGLYAVQAAANPLLEAHQAVSCLGFFEPVYTSKQLNEGGVFSRNAAAQKLVSLSEFGAFTHADDQTILVRAFSDWNFFESRIFSNPYGQGEEPGGNKFIVNYLEALSKINPKSSSVAEELAKRLSKALQANHLNVRLAAGKAIHSLLLRLETPALQIVFLENLNINWNSYDSRYYEGAERLVQGGNQYISDILVGLAKISPTPETRFASPGVVQQITQHLQQAARSRIACISESAQLILKNMNYLSRFDDKVISELACMPF